MEAAACARSATGYTYARREPEKTALFQVIQQHLLTFRPPLANDRLKILDDNVVRLEFKKPWSDGDGRGAAAWGRGGAGRP
jgi:hypothetical protein